MKVLETRQDFKPFWISVSDEEYLKIIQCIGKKDVYTIQEIYFAVKAGDLIKNN